MTVVLELAGRIVAALCLVTWLYLTFGNGRSWRTDIGLPHGTVDPDVWPSVTAVVPARDEADVLPQTLPTLVGQRYPGRFAVLVVDDDSADGTGELAARLGAQVVRTAGPPSGWTGKVAAMAAGVDAAGAPDFVLCTDADIAYPPDAVTRLVRAATAQQLDLVSQMVRLRAVSRWERIVVPAFVYFFAQLYPFARVNRPGRTAAAAGGCMLVRRSTLDAAGGLARIRGALIDDVALGRLIKPHGAVWLGLSRDIASVRAYPRLADLWQMVARSAYTQLRCSPLLLGMTLIGLVFTYLVPPAALVIGAVTGDPLLAALGAAAWALLAATYVPMLRYFRVPFGWALTLPGVAALYALMTADSARRHWAGRGGAWKGRTAQRPIDAP